MRLSTSESKTSNRDCTVESLPNSLNNGPGYVTIYSGSEEERATLEVPLQKEFTAGPGSLILLSSTASIRCADIGICELLEHMNIILQTEYTLSESLETLLRYCLDSQPDFGFAYALLRPRWHMEASAALADIRLCEKTDRELREGAIAGDVVVDLDMPPRRIWDLWSNRIVPIWMTTPYQGERRNKAFIAVSHSWMDASRRQNVDTPINGHQWPVPIPSDSTLERVRVELLHHAARLDVNLAWLDVLCLRQVGSLADERLRLDEWRLDVPTIGAIYPDAYRVVYYYSGLGRAFQGCDFESPRHWQNRAWTLQETNANSITGGISASSPSMPCSDAREQPIDECIRAFYEKLDVWSSFSHVVDNFMFTVLDAMRHRSATSEIDKIAGLNYYLAKFGSLPAYIEGEDSESSWIRLVQKLDSMHRGDLFFLFPAPGNGKYQWCPSWQQVKDAPTLPSSRTIRQYVRLNEHSGTYNLKGCRLTNCFVKNLENPLEVGTIEITGKDGGPSYSFPVVADHTQCIPDGFYTLVGGTYTSRHWVVGLMTEYGLFEKVSVLRLGDSVMGSQVTKFSEELVVHLM